MLSSLSLLIERTPDEVQNDDGGMKTNISLSNYGSDGGMSYDSSVAGMAANSLLSQFFEGGNINININNPSMTQRQHQGQSQQQQQLHQVQQQGQSQSTTSHNLAFLLADALAQILNTTNTTNNTTIIRTMQIRAAIALNQLAATEPPPPMATAYDQEQYSPYGHPAPSASSSLLSIPTSWCHVLVNSHALSSLVQRLLTLPHNNNSGNGDLEIIEKCAWAVGNLAGDSETAREALYGMGAVSGLIGCISSSLGHISSLVETQQQQQQQMNIDQCLINLIRNSIWALTNLVRFGGIAASEILSINNNGQEQGQAMKMMSEDDSRPYCLTKRDLAMLLTSPENTMFPPANATMRTAASSPSSSLSSNSNTRTCWQDVALETCWFLSFLTRDEDAVRHLCEYDDHANAHANITRKENCVVSALLSRLDRSADATQQQLLGTSGGDAAATTCAQDAECSIPCIRALRNMAWEDDSNTDAILAAVPGTAESALVRLMSLGTLGAGSSISALASEAASLSGALLRSANYPPEICPATVACRTLLPALCAASVHPSSTFEFRREAVRAMWTAVHCPRYSYGEEDAVRAGAEAMQPEFLAEIVRTDGMAGALIGMTNTLDSDAVEASLRLIDLLLRRDDELVRNQHHRFNGDMIGKGLLPGGKKKMSIHFEESGLVDALWRICDHDSEESDVAELAADILDDFYEQEEEDEEDQSMLEPVTLGGQFQFQAPSASTSGIPEGGFNLGGSMVAPSLEREHVPVMGRGRGRGQAMPAWMQRQQQI